jgi:hypothetical protein
LATTVLTGDILLGIGISKQPISILNLKKGIYGHRGHTGAFALYEPEIKTCLSGTANQFIGQNEAAKAMIKVLRHPIAPGN